MEYDVIVAGVGGMGSATVAELAARGARVLGLDRDSIPNASGSSHGVNRIIRLAYMEDPAYVPLLRRAYERWRNLGDRLGEPVLFITGGVDVGLPEQRDGVRRPRLRACPWAGARAAGCRRADGEVSGLPGTHGVRRGVPA